MRVDLYTLIHKAQRFHLSNLSNEIGTADLQPEGMRRVSGRIRHIISHLRDHAKNEETYIHPLFRQAGAVEVGQLDREHHELEAALKNIESVLDEERWNELYKEYSRFLGNYLVHLSEEEAAQIEILWTRYDDAALLAAFSRFKSERAPQAAKEDLEFMLPALSDAEIIRMYLGMKASAPTQVFQGACEIGADILGQHKWAQLFASIQKG